eukprot:2676053-Pleurochrysis_carterae.AAC.2
MKAGDVRILHAGEGDRAQLGDRSSRQAENSARLDCATIAKPKHAAMRGSEQRKSEEGIAAQKALREEELGAQRSGAVGIEAR